MVVTGSLMRQPGASVGSLWHTSHTCAYPPCKCAPHRIFQRSGVILHASKYSKAAVKDRGKLSKGFDDEGWGKEDVSQESSSKFRRQPPVQPPARQRDDSLDEGMADPRQRSSEAGMPRRTRVPLDEAPKSQRGQESQEKRQLIFRKILSKEISAAQNWREVQALLQKHIRIVDHVNLVAMLSTLGKLTERAAAASPADEQEQAELVSQLFALVSEQLPKCGAKELASLVYSMGRLGLVSDTLLASLVAEAGPKLKTFGPPELASFLYALGRMSISPGQEWLQAYLQVSYNKLDSFKAVELSNTIMSLARLAHRPDPYWLNGFTTEAFHKLALFGPTEWSNMMYGLGLLSVRLDGSWLDACIQFSRPKLSAFRGIELKRFVWALSQFDYRPPRNWQDAFLESFGRNLRYCNNEDLLTIAVSMAYLRFTITDPSLARSLVRALQTKRAAYTEQEVSSINAALEAMGFKTKLE